ncbi:MAG: AMP-binding protein, partial [Planctomycetales bacterium]|nr:AMP-binding protein [Planctomycetales bacterium]
GDFAEIAKEVQRECPFIEHYIQFAEPQELIARAIGSTELISTATALWKNYQTEDSSELARQYQAATAAIVPTDGAQVIYTTGSTGLPKPALLSHRNITCQNMCMAVAFELFDSPSMLVNLPPSHVGCQAEQLMTTLFAGQTAILLHVFDAEKSLQAIDKYGAACYGQVPAMFNLQWRLPNYAKYDLSSVKKVMFGGQQVPREFIEQLLSYHRPLGTGLGLSEMAGFVTYTGLTEDVAALSESLGWWMPVTPMTIRKPMKEDGTAGEELSWGEKGEICFSGPQVFIDYVNNPEAYAKTVSSDGICYTGDLGSIGENGLIFSGRSKLVIKPKGYQIHPAQVESHFAQLKDQISICGAVGASHHVFSEAVVLFIEMKPEIQLTREQLEQHALGIASFMRPLHYVLLEPGAFPLNRISKIDYVKLSELAQQETEQLRAQGGWDC